MEAKVKIVFFSFSRLLSLSHKPHKRIFTSLIMNKALCDNNKTESDKTAKSF